MPLITVNGRELHYAEQGDGPLAVLIHGYPLDHTLWLDQLAALSDIRRVVAIDLPGYGMSERVTGAPLTMELLAEDVAGLIEELEYEQADIVGLSMGGRIASHVADGSGVRGLVCLGYPFHPPGRPERLRTAHLLDLATPALIVQGTRDPFGTPEEIDGYRLPSSIRLHFLEDGDHSFKPRKRSGRTPEQNMKEAVEAVGRFVTGTRDPR